MCSQYVLRFADQDRTVGAAKRSATRGPQQFCDPVSAVMRYDEKLNRLSLFGEVVQAVAVDGDGLDLEIGVAR